MLITNLLFILTLSTKHSILRRIKIFTSLPQLAINAEI